MTTAAGSDTAPALSFEGLSVDRGGRPVLRDVSISIPPGEITALLGPNGAGKSTLVLAVGGVLRPTSGTIALGDVDLTRRRPEQVRAAGVAIVPEGRQLLPNLTVEDNLRIATYALPRNQARDGVAHALELFPELERRWRTLARGDFTTYAGDPIAHEPSVGPANAKYTSSWLASRQSFCFTSSTTPTTVNQGSSLRPRRGCSR